jgi:hypothetical protein
VPVTALNNMIPMNETDFFIMTTPAIRLFIIVSISIWLLHGTETSIALTYSSWLKTITAE